MTKTLLISLFLFGLASTTLAKDYPPNCLAAHVENLVDSPYAGQYSGPYNVKASVFGNQSGNFTLSIGLDGKVTGKAENYTVSRTTDISGSVDENGDINLIAEWSDSTYTIKGTVTKTSSGHLQGTLTQYADKKVVCMIEIDLSPSSSGIDGIDPSDPVLIASHHAEVDPVTAASQDAQRKRAERDAAVQNPTSLSQANTNLDKIFCLIAQSVGKGCDDRLSLEELTNGLRTYLQNSGYASTGKADSVDFDSISRLNAVFGDGVGHIEVTYRKNRYASAATTPRIYVPGTRVYTPPPVVSTPSVAVHWWVLNNPYEPGKVAFFVADNIDQPYAPLKSYSSMLADSIDPKNEGTNSTKLNAYFKNNRTYRK